MILQSGIIFFFLFLRFCGKATLATPVGEYIVLLICFVR